MKIVDRKTFLELPENTVYCKYDEGAFGDLCIKQKNITENDWYYISLSECVRAESSEILFDLLDKAELNNEELPISFDSVYRDGLFDENQKFIVWSDNDVLDLITTLCDCCSLVVRGVEVNPY